MNAFQEDTITLRKREIKVKTGYLPHTELLFYAENPRIYSIIWKDNDSEPTQKEIFDALSETEHVRNNLVPSIKNNGGLIEPVLVRKNVVLEGNSRLAAYRILSQKDDIAWAQIRVRILPDSISDSDVFSLLGEFHIVGKKDWNPYEQAGYLYRRFKFHGIPEDQLHNEVGLTKAKIRHLIQVYDFMLENDDRNPARWSYYDQLLSRRFNPARELYPNFDKKIADMIQDESIERAVDIRDNLPKIIKVGGSTLKKFMNDKFSFHEALEDARLRGAGNYYSRKFSEFRKWLNDENFDSELSNIPTDEKPALSYELNAIERRIKQLINKLGMKANTSRQSNR